MIHFYAVKRVLLWMASHIWSLFLFFRVHKEEPHNKFYRLLNSSCNAFIDLIIHRALWKSYICCFQSFKVSFGFNKIDHEKSKSMKSKAIVWRNNWCQLVNYLCKPGTVACTCNTAALETEFRNVVGSLLVEGNLTRLPLEPD